MKVEIKINANGLEDYLRTEKSSGFKSWEENTYNYLWEEVKDIEVRQSKIISGSYKSRIVMCTGIRYYFNWSFSDKRLNLKYLTFLCEIPEEGRIQEIVKGALAFKW